MMATARFPWDQVKAESLRILCRDLGGPAGRRDEMVTFLQTTEEQGGVCIYHCFSPVILSTISTITLIFFS